MSSVSPAVTVTTRPVTGGMTRSWPTWRSSFELEVVGPPEGHHRDAEVAGDPGQGVAGADRVGRAAGPLPSCDGRVDRDRLEQRAVVERRALARRTAGRRRRTRCRRRRRSVAIGVGACRRRPDAPESSSDDGVAPGRVRRRRRRCGPRCRRRSAADGPPCAGWQPRRWRPRHRARSRRRRSAAIRSSREADAISRHGGRRGERAGSVARRSRAEGARSRQAAAMTARRAAHVVRQAGRSGAGASTRSSGR